MGSLGGVPLSRIEFVVRCRKTPVDPKQFLDGIDQDAHVEFIPGMIINALFIANGHRQDVSLHLVLEKTQDYSRVLTFDGEHLGNLGGFTEAALLASCASALSEGRGLGKEEGLTAGNGITVTAKSFERLMDELMQDSSAYLLDPKGEALSTIAPIESGVFVLTDQLAMPKNAQKGLVRKGCKLISLGKRVLFASQCISLIHGAIAQD